MLEIRNLTKVYRSKTGEEVRALDNVSVSFPEQGMVFILGKSGSGKSTLLNIMGGLDSYDSGEFIIKGKSSADFVGSDFDAYRNTFIGFIFQEYNILDDFTVGANIGLALELQGKKATDEAISAILEKVGMLEYAKRKPNELSGGQKQRVAIARALVKDPQIIMADEPTGALDSNTGKQIFDALKALSREKLVLVVSHDRDFAERYADRIIELADGKIIEDVTKHEHHAEKVSDGMHRINDHILRIEKGYRLTARDLEMINAYLENAGGDVLLSGDGRINDELRSAAGIGQDGSTAVFEGTVPERDVRVKKYEKGDAKFIRSRLPMKNAVKMGASGLKHKKFRLVMTILLSFISFAMFGLSSSMAAYDKMNAATQSIIDTQIRSAAVTMGVRRTTTYDDGDMYTWHEQHAMTEEDLARLKNETGLDFHPVFTGSQYNHGDGGFAIDHLFKQYESNSVYTGRIAGMLTMTEEELPDDYTLVGRLPEAAGEIAITEFMFRQFRQYGYSHNGTVIEGSSLTMTGDGSDNDIIGKVLMINKIGYNQLSDSSAFELTIVGVVNTNFNYDRYQNLMPKDDQQGVPEEEPTMMDMFLEREISYERDYGFHGLAFVHENDIEAMTSYVGGAYGGGNVGEHMGAGNSTMYFAAYKPADNDIDDDENINLNIYYVADGAKLSQLTSILWKNDAQTSLADNEALISALSLQEYMRDGVAAVDYDALESLLTGMSSKLDLAVYQEFKNNNYTPLRAARNAMLAKYINERLAASPALAEALLQEAAAQGYSGWSAYEYWSFHWFYYNSGETAYVPPQVAGVTVKTVEALELELYADTVLQNEILAIYGIAAPAYISAESVKRLADELSYYSDGSSFSLDDAYHRVGGFYLTNFIMEHGYHLAENYNQSYVKNFLQNLEISNTDWIAMTDAERLARLTNDTWSLRYDLKRYDISYEVFHKQVFDSYFAMTGTTVADLFALLDSCYYQMEIHIHGSDDGSKELYKSLENLSIVGLFFEESDSSNLTVMNSTVYNEYITWEKEQYAFENKVEINNSYTEDRVEHEPGMYAFAVAAIAANDEAAIAKLVSMSYADEHTTDYLFEMQNAVMYTLGNFNEIIEILAKVFVWVGLGLAVFSSLLLMNFISTSISYKKREIGILRAVGAKSSDVFKIFFSEAFIIALINFLLATAASIAAVIILNFYMRNSGINITLLSFGPLQIAIMLGVSVVVAVLASFLPVYGIARKKPVDAIKDR